MSAATEAAAAPRRVRPFYWSIRRELWENRALWIAPLAVEAVVLLAFVFASFSLPRAVAAAKTGQALNMPYAAAAGAAFMISFIVAIFYALAALQGERRDRSLLFWKSLPVSDTTTVLSKAAIPLIVQPVIALVVTLAAHVAMLVWGTLVMLLSGNDPTDYWRYLHLPLIWVMLPYGLLMNSLWDAPFYGWLLLVSAWAKRATFVWAVGPWLGLMLFEFLVFRTPHMRQLVSERLFGGFDRAYTVPVPGKENVPISSLSQVDPMRYFADPGFWGGLAFGAACLAACVWLRRRHDPL
jgi:ABC-2 type transport system permease protein